MTAFQIARLDEISPLDVWQGVRRLPIRDHFDVRSFGVNAYVGSVVGAEIIEAHDHRGGSTAPQEELYFVLAGRATFEIDGETAEAPAGTFVFVRPDASRRAVAQEPETVVLVVGAPLGAAYTPPPWPADAGMWRFRELWSAGEIEAARTYLDGVIARYPGNPGILYFRAACALHLGDREAAVRDLAAAESADSSVAAQAASDPLFTALRSG